MSRGETPQNQNPEELPELELQPQIPEQAEKEEIDPGLRQAAVQIFGDIFDKNESGERRVEKILHDLRAFLDSDLLDGKSMSQALSQCGNEQDRKIFIEKSISAVRPIIDLRKNNPDAFERLRSRAATERFKLLNEILSYGESGDTVHIHLALLKDLLAQSRGKEKKDEIKKLLTDGLERLAEIMKDRPEIKNVTATSWLLAKKQGRKQLEDLGFVYDGPISDEMRRLHFAHDMDKNGNPREISLMHINREAFLEKYGKK